MTNYKVCRWCDHIRFDTNDLIGCLTVGPEPNSYIIHPCECGSICDITKKKIIDKELETCPDWEIMDYAF